jgi:hypothetical protein
MVETNVRTHHVDDNVVAIRPINAVRGVQGFVRKMTDEQELALLIRQIDEKLTNAQLAAIAGVNEDTINQMKRRHGCVGRRGPSPKYSEDEKRGWLKRGEDEGLSGEGLAKLVGVADRKIIYAWKAELKRLDQMRAALAGTPVEVQTRKLVQVMAPPMPPDRRRVTMRRPDGVEIEVQVSTDEMMRLLGLKIRASRTREMEDANFGTAVAAPKTAPVLVAAGTAAAPGAWPGNRADRRSQGIATPCALLLPELG